MPEGERSSRRRDDDFRRWCEDGRCFGSDNQGGVKTKSDFASVKIVVDGFGDANDVDRFIKEIARDVLRAIAAGDDHGVDTRRRAFSVHKEE